MVSVVTHDNRMLIGAKNLCQMEPKTYAHKC